MSYIEVDLSCRGNDEKHNRRRTGTDKEYFEGITKYFYSLFLYLFWLFGSFAKYFYG